MVGSQLVGYLLMTLQIIMKGYPRALAITNKK